LLLLLLLEVMGMVRVLATTLLLRMLKLLLV
jgi:hypothetical protein